MTGIRGPGDEPVETTRVNGILRLLWRCESCGAENDRELGGTPWNCDECGSIDRDVEAWVDHYVDARERGGPA